MAELVYITVMFTRHIHKQPLPVPSDMDIPEETLPLENVSHTPGQAAAIRFFDPSSEEDLFAMRDILKGKQTKKWMDDPGRISLSDYQDWAGTATKTSFLFAVHDARLTDLNEVNYVRGFVYIYSEREEKFRVKRMEKQGFLQPYEGERYALEISFAARPLPDGVQSGSGLMSSAVRQSCLQVQLLLESTNKPKVEIFAFVDQDNLAAQRTLDACGFTKRGQMKYDWDSEGETALYILDWDILNQKVRAKLQEVVRAHKPVNEV